MQLGGIKTRFNLFLVIIIYIVTGTHTLKNFCRPIFP